MGDDNNADAEDDLSVFFRDGLTGVGPYCDSDDDDVAVEDMCC